MVDTCLIIPPPNYKKPRAIIKFLGGAFIGKVSHVTYRYDFCYYGFYFWSFHHQILFNWILAFGHLMVIYVVYGVLMDQQFGIEFKIGSHLRQ